MFLSANAAISSRCSPGSVALTPTTIRVTPCAAHSATCSAIMSIDPARVYSSARPAAAARAISHCAARSAASSAPPGK